jgi:hypothetical protein
MSGRVKRVKMLRCRAESLFEVALSLNLTDDEKHYQKDSGAILLEHTEVVGRLHFRNHHRLWVVSEQGKRKP